MSLALVVSLLHPTLPSQYFPAPRIEVQDRKPIGSLFDETLMQHGAHQRPPFLHAAVPAAAMGIQALMSAH